MAIRILIGPFGALLLFSAVVMAWFYPLTREKHACIRRLLARRKERQNKVRRTFGKGEVV
jgi:Na+/melibiose symporter-like transporter